MLGKWVPRAQGHPRVLCVDGDHLECPWHYLGWQHCLLRVPMPRMGQLSIIPVLLLLLEPLPTPVFGCVPAGLADRDP